MVAQPARGLSYKLGNLPQRVVFQKGATIFLGFPASQDNSRAYSAAPFSKGELAGALGPQQGPVKVPSPPSRSGY